MAYSPKAKLAVIKMHQDGMSLREIEREFGIDRKDIRLNSRLAVVLARQPLKCL